MLPNVLDKKIVNSRGLDNASMPVCLAPLLASPAPPLCTVCGVSFISSFFNHSYITWERFRSERQTKYQFTSFICLIFRNTPAWINIFAAFGRSPWVLPSVDRCWFFEAVLKPNGTHAMTPFTILDVSTLEWYYFFGLLVAATFVWGVVRLPREHESRCNLWINSTWH